MKTRAPRLLPLLALVGLFGCKDCGKNDDGYQALACAPEEGCADGQACEPVHSGPTHVCAGPIEIRGEVHDGHSDADRAGVLVRALDASGAVVAETTTDAAGRYVLPVSAARDIYGGVVDARWTLSWGEEGEHTSAPIDAVDVLYEGDFEAPVFVLETPDTQLTR